MIFYCCVQVRPIGCHFANAPKLIDNAPNFGALAYFGAKTTQHVLNFTLGAQHGGVHNEEPGLDGAQLGKLIREMTENAESRVFIRGTTLTALATIKRLTDRGIDPGKFYLQATDHKGPKVENLYRESVQVE